MLGTWGISANLKKLNDKYFNIISRERNHYRRINKIKKHNLFEHEVPLEYSSNIYAIYYNEDFSEAAVLFYRMFRNEKPVKRIIQTQLKPGEYQITNVDNNSINKISGNEIQIGMRESQMSAIYFIKQIN